jgi:predicted transcriptional regulator of viral defense system
MFVMLSTPTDPTDLDPLQRNRLLAVASHQAGLFTTEQAREAGYSRRAQSYHVGTGEWERVQLGILRLRAWPLTESESVVRWSLWAGPTSVVSHESAARLWGLGDIVDYEAHLTVPVRFPRRTFRGRGVAAPRLVLHRDTLGEEEIEYRDGYRITRPVRTVLDLAASGVEGTHLARAVLSLRAFGVGSWDEVLAGAARRGTRAVAALVGAEPHGALGGIQ